MPRCPIRLWPGMHPEKGREQLRHVFGRAPDWARTGYFASQVFILLKRCYRELGDREMAARCAMEARGCVSVRAPALWTGKQRHADGLSFSLIVPTYNRLPILRKCLEALEAQTLSSKNFEVIVVDDGSSDGTEALLSQYRPPFRFQYLRQTNSGTGAARRIGVAHASGASAASATREHMHSGRRGCSVNVNSRLSVST